MDYKLRADRSEPGALPDFKCLRAAVNYLCGKFSKIFTGSGVAAFQKSDTSRKTSLGDLRSTGLYLSFLTRWVQ